MKNPTYSVEIVKKEAHGQWVGIISGIDSRFSEAAEKIGNHVACPIGTGSKDGFRFEQSSNQDGHAFSNTGEKLGSGLDVLMWANGYDFKTALKEVADYLSLTSTNSTPKPNNAPQAQIKPPQKQEKPKTNTIPIKIWEQASSETGAPIKEYLKSRGLLEALPLPSSLKTAENLEYSEGTGSQRKVLGKFPSLIGKITKNSDLVGVQRQYLNQDGSKADVETQKSMLSIGTRACSGGAVYLGAPTDTLAITEGIENGLAVQIATGIPTWAATTGALLSKVEIPEAVKTVYIFADKDTNGAGEKSATNLLNRLNKQKIKVALLMPPLKITNNKGVDWLDVLNESGKEPFKIAIQEASQKESEKQRQQAEKATTTNKAKEKILASIEEINKTHCIVTIGSKSAVMREITDHDTDSLKYDLLQINAFKDLFNNRTEITGYNNNGTPKFEKLGALWMTHPERRTYSEGAYFLPMSKPLKDGTYQKYKNKLNMWRGFSIKPIDYTRESIEVINEHLLENVCDGDQEAYKYLINWMAFGVQNPEKQCGVAVVLRGLKGRGKGLIGSLLTKIYGQYSRHLSNSKQLTGNFNAHLENVCYVFADEAIFHGDTAGNQRLKALVTEGVITIERKGFDAVQVPNRLNILMASNSDWVVPSSKDERRWFVLDLSDSKHSPEYYAELHKATQDDKSAAQYLDFLLKRDLTKFNVRTYPETIGNTNQKLHSLEVIPRFLLDACERGYIAESIKDYDESEWYEKISTVLIAEGLNEWGKTNFKSAYERQSNLQITSYLNKIGFKSKMHTRVWCFSKGKPIEKRGQSRGFDIGLSDELKDRIMSYEEIKTPASQKDG